jgi:hypothetical protein
MTRPLVSWRQASRRRRSEEIAQFFRYSFRHFLWKEMTGIERPATDVIGPSPPQRQGAACFRVPSL